MNRARGRLDSGDRGVSEVLGTALLIGFVVTAAVLLLLMGSETSDDIEEQNRVQSASQSLQQIAAEFESIDQSESESVEFQLPDEVREDVRTESRTRVSLFANGNTTCTTGDVDIGTLVYESESGDVVGYEFGGVWQQHGQNSSSMVRPPNLEYRDGRLAVSLSQMETALQGSHTMEAGLNKTASSRLTANLTRSLFVNKTAMELTDGPETPVGRLSGCTPQDVDNITVVIEDSRFATAWHTYAHRTFDDRLVDVSPGQSGSVGSGDRVEITFEVQDTNLPEFVVADVEADPSAPADTDVSVTTTIENVGDLSGTKDVSFSVYKETTSGWQPVSDVGRIEETTLSAGESVEYGFTIPANETEPGTYRYSIDTGEEVYNETVEIGDPDDDPPNFELTSLDAPDSASLGSSQSITATIENTGDRLDNQTVTFAFDGGEEATRTVELNASEETTLTFDIPTEEKGADRELTVSSADDSETTTITIGTQPYFEISETQSPATVEASTPFEINASITNTGDIEGTQSVDLRVQNVTNGTGIAETSSSLALEGNLSRSGSDTGEAQEANWTIESIDEPGTYNYTVSTANETVSKTFYVGEKPTSLFQVSTVRADPNPVEQNETTTVTAVVNNTGGSIGEQPIEFEFADGTTVEKQRTLAPGDGTTVEFDYNVPSDLPAGTYDYTVRSENTSVTGQLRVAANLSDSFERGDDGQIVIDGNTTARLQVLGTEPTALSYDYGWYGSIDSGDIYRAPTVMDIVTENESAGQVAHDVWGGMDLNRPSVWDDQVARAAYLNQTITIEEASSLWVSATTYGCSDGGYQDSGLDRYVDSYGTFDRYYCQDWGSPLVSTNSNQNTENVVILGDGEQVPSWGSATPDQRSISDILDDRFDSETGELDLEDDQLVLLFELTQPDADPDNASPDVDGDPDYNDAVVLFEVVNRTRTVKTPTQLEITDLEAPTAVDEGETGTLRVEVTNKGGQEGSTDVASHFDGMAAGSESTGELAHNESSWVEFDLPPNGGYDSGTYGYEVSLTANPNQTQSGNVYVGSNPEPKFIVQGFERSYPRTVAQGSDQSVTATIANVGDEKATMPVVWYVDGDRRTERNITLEAGESKTDTFDRISTDEIGTVDFEVMADNSGYDAADSSKSGTINVETEQFHIDHVRVGRETYDEGELILVTNLERLDALIENTESVPGNQTVDFTLTNRSTGETKTSSTSASLDGNDAAFEPFSLGSWSNATGYYDYTIETEDDTFSGTIQIVESADAYPEAQDPDYISIDMNVITFE